MHRHIGQQVSQVPYEPRVSIAFDRTLLRPQERHVILEESRAPPIGILYCQAVPIFPEKEKCSEFRLLCRVAARAVFAHELSSNGVQVRIRETEIWARLETLPSLVSGDPVRYGNAGVLC